MIDIHVPTRRELLEQQKYLVPQAALKLVQHGQELTKEGHSTAAATALKRAVAITGPNPVVYSILGGVLYDECDYEDAEKWLRLAIEIEPGYAPAQANLGSVLGAMKKYDEAHSHYQRAIDLEPTYVDAKWNFAMSLLDSGKWSSKAWDLYDIRLQKGQAHLFPKLPYPRWKGENLNGKTLYVQGEQGIGDRILFSRYLHWIKKEFPESRILYMLNATDLPDLGSLMWGFKGVVDTFLPTGIPWPQDVDYGIYLMSLPGLHGTTAENVYPDPGLLRAQAERFRRSLSLPTADPRMIKVGVVWQGSQGMKRTAERNIPFEYMLALAELPNVVVYSLQFNNDEIRRYNANQLIWNLVPQVAPFGFVGTAATMLQLDVVISACTSTAHLAGALGIENVWIPLCKNPYWVWMQERKDSVWYPKVELFRQNEMVNWHPVMTELRERLKDYADQRYKEAA